MTESHTIGPAAEPEKHDILEFTPIAAAAALGSYRWPCAGLQLDVEHDVDAIHCHKRNWINGRGKYRISYSQDLRNLCQLVTRILESWHQP